MVKMTTMNSAILKYKIGAVLNSYDRVILLKYIKDCNDTGLLSEAIYIYAYCFPLDIDVLKICNSYIVDRQVPEISAACLKAVLLMWGVCDSDIERSFNKFLNVDSFEIFFDECMVIRRFLRSKNGRALCSDFSLSLNRFETWMRKNGYDLT